MNLMVNFFYAIGKLFKSEGVKSGAEEIPKDNYPLF